MRNALNNFSENYEHDNIVSNTIPYAIIIIIVRLIKNYILSRKCTFNIIFTENVGFAKYLKGFIIFNTHLY